MARYTIYAVNIESTVVGGCQSNGINLGPNVIVQSGDGLVDPTFSALMSAEPRLDFETRNVAAALGAAGIDGLGYTSNLIFYLQQLADGGTRTAGSNHLTVTSAAGLLVPQRLSVRQDQLATLTMAAYCKSSDGSTFPLAIATGQALAAGAGDAQAFTLGPASINGTDIGELTGLDIDFGLRVQVRRSKGLPYATFLFIEQRQPSITLRSMDASLLNTFGVAGAAINASDVICYCRHIADGGVRTADGTTSHLKFTVDEGRIQANQVSASHPNEHEIELAISPTYDGSNAIIAVSTGSAIT